MIGGLKFCISLIIVCFLTNWCWDKNLFAQSFQIVEGDTINLIDADSLKQGLWKEYYKTTGNIKSEVYYVNGKRDGLEIVWYNIPHCIQYEATYKNGELDGPIRKYSRWCNLEKEEYYKNGLKSGYQRTYHANGRIKTEANFKEGVLIGTYKTYDDKGELLFESKTEIDELELKPDTLLVQKPSLDRILNPTINQSDKVLVTDITGSMYPYAKQVISWYEKYLKNNQQQIPFVFFNDGDRKPQAFKTLGNTGGIYSVQTDKLDEVLKTMSIAIKNGGGGDLAENNVEAILTALTQFPTAKSVVLIADNTAPVRDIELAKRIKKPVKIILCAFDRYDEVNPDFILIAYLTKGSLHTFDTDLIDFSKVTGNSFEINGVNYLIYQNKKVIRL